MTAITRPAHGASPRRALAVITMAVALMIAGTAAANADDGTYAAEFPGERPVEGEHVHVVESGEYLSTIAADYGLDNEDGWRVLFDANEHIDDPNLIYVGGEITIPEDGETITSRDLPSGTTPPEPAPDPEPEPASAETSQEETASEPEQSEPAPEPAVSNGSVWDRLAQCESNGDWSINTGNGFYGGLQFTKSSWDAAGGDQYAQYPHQASRAQQIAAAERLLDMQGWGAWPACSSKLGLR